MLAAVRQRRSPTSISGLSDGGDGEYRTVCFDQLKALERSKFSGPCLEVVFEDAWYKVIVKQGPRRRRRAPPPHIVPQHPRRASTSALTLLFRRRRSQQRQGSPALLRGDRGGGVARARRRDGRHPADPSGSVVGRVRRNVASHRAQGSAAQPQAAGLRLEGGACRAAGGCAGGRGGRGGEAS